MYEAQRCFPSMAGITIVHTEVSHRSVWIVCISAMKESSVNIVSLFAWVYLSDRDAAYNLLKLVDEIYSNEILW